MTENIRRLNTKSEANDVIMQLFNSKGKIFVPPQKTQVILIRRQLFSSCFFLNIFTYKQQRGKKSRRDKDKTYTQPHTYSLDLPVQM